MNKISLFLFLQLLVCSCNRSLRTDNDQSSKQSDSVYHPVKINFEYDSSLTIEDSDSLYFKTTGHDGKTGYIHAYANSVNSFVSISGDTLRIFISCGTPFERGYEATFYILPDTAWLKYGVYRDYGVFENYVSTFSSIRVNKHTYQPGDYLTLQVHNEVIGKLDLKYHIDYDSVTMVGKIKLKIRDFDFTSDDLYYENKRNEFYALLSRRPDTMTNLSLHNCDFKSLPKEIGRFINLRHLDLTGNDFSKSDLKALQQFKNLQSLNISTCHLRKVPDAVLSMHKLESLDLSENDISELPKQLYHLSALKELWLAGNLISELSTDIRNLKNLEILSTYDTRIRVYPKEMIQLKKLVELIPNDSMVFIPDTLKRFFLRNTPVFYR